MFIKRIAQEPRFWFFSEPMMKCLSLILLLCFGCIGLVQSVYSTRLADCECGVTNEEPSPAYHIINGEHFDKHQYPWLVYILRNRNRHCGGALINSKYVITAGHCVVNVSKHALTVVLGRHDTTTSDGVETDVRSVVMRKDFVSDAVHDTNDLALLRLLKSIRFTKNISPICLPNPLSEYTNRKAVIAGWGKTDAYAAVVPPNVPTRAYVTIKPDKYCLKSEIGAHFSDAMMCAYARDKDACQGDSGSPLMYERNGTKMELIGVVSWGIGCGRKNVPGVYVKLVNFLKWIERHTRHAAYCKIN